MELKIFANFPSLRYGISEKEDGFMNIKPMGSAEQNKVARENRSRFYEKRGIDERTVFTPYLVHGGEAVMVDGKNIAENIRADGFVSDRAGTTMIITVADCFPLYLYDPVKSVIGIAHAGWRGIMSGIVSNTMYRFKELGSRPEDILLGIGPGIQKCYFSVRDDVIDRFSNYKDFIRHDGENYFVDLEGIIKKQAREIGLVDIESSGECTHCLSDKYFSYRRDKPRVPEVMLAYISRSRI